MVTQAVRGLKTPYNCSIKIDLQPTRFGNPPTFIMLLHPRIVVYCLKASCVPKLCHVTSHLSARHYIILTLVVALEMALEALEIALEAIFLYLYKSTQQTKIYVFTYKLYIQTF